MPMTRVCGTEGDERISRKSLPYFSPRGISEPEMIGSRCMHVKSLSPTRTYISFDGCIVWRARDSNDLGTREK